MIAFERKEEVHVKVWLGLVITEGPLRIGTTAWTILNAPPKK